MRTIRFIVNNDTITKDPTLFFMKGEIVMEKNNLKPDEEKENDET